MEPLANTREPLSEALNSVSEVPVELSDDSKKLSSLEKKDIIRFGDEKCAPFVTRA